MVAYRLFVWVLVSTTLVACSSAPSGRAGPELPPPGKLGILLRGMDAAQLQRLVSSIREVEGRDIEAVDDGDMLAALEACADYPCRVEIARALGFTHVVYGALKKLGRNTIRAQLATVLVATPDGWATNNLTFSTTGFEMRVCEMILADARIYAKPLSPVSPSVAARRSPFGACHSEVVRAAPLPVVEWPVSAAAVPSRIQELDAWYEKAGVDISGSSPDARTLKAYLGKKPEAPSWVAKTTWSETTDQDEVFFSVGKYFVQPGVPAEMGIETAEQNAVEQAVGGLPSPESDDAPGPTVRAIDYYSEGVSIFALVAITRPLSKEKP